MKSKQVIVIRKDLNMRKGKIVAQGAHASVKVILDMMIPEARGSILELNPDTPLIDWITGSFTKICVSVDSEQELIDIYEKAIASGLHASIITDSGLTEFGGVPTRTAVAIGPNWSNDIDTVTGNLKLL